jgi:hypothetical protein
LNGWIYLLALATLTSLAALRCCLRCLIIVLLFFSLTSCWCGHTLILLIAFDLVIFVSCGCICAISCLCILRELFRFCRCKFRWLRAKLYSEFFVIIASFWTSAAFTIIIVIIISTIGLALFPLRLPFCLVSFLSGTFFGVILCSSGISVSFELLLREQEVDLHPLLAAWQ